MIQWDRFKISFCVFGSIQSKKMVENAQSDCIQPNAQNDILKLEVRYAPTLCIIIKFISNKESP